MKLRGVEEYNVGLDLGTGSVGWAATDTEGNLLKFKSKPTWGSRLFSSANTAAETRLIRGQRRRYDRRRQRLDLLQGFFGEEMAEVDPEFFIRLKQSRLLPEDRTEGGAYHWPLFNGSDFTEKDYYKRFPTIYHLREWLVSIDEKADIRLIYLAFHNIVKARGNFLHESAKLSAKTANAKEALERFCAALEEWCEEKDIEAPKASPTKLKSILEDVSMRLPTKRDALKKAIGFEKGYEKASASIALAFVGYKAEFAPLFLLEPSTETKFELSNDESVDKFVETLCPDDGLELFESIQAVHSSYVLSTILRGSNGGTISTCKVQEYERYADDLALLKALVREYVPDEYDAFFKGPHYEGRRSKDYDVAQVQKLKNYTAYNLKKLDYDAFRKEVEKLFEGSTAAKSDERYQSMMQGFVDSTFLRRLKTSDNGSIPHQLHLEEMDAIILKQKAHHPFLDTYERELKSLVTFRIPYYVGPLTCKNAAVDKKGDKRFAWATRKPGMAKARVYPWNWEEVIDKEQSADDFINRMTGDCTYLYGEDVLPRCSLIYEEFCVRNEFNGAKWSKDGDDFVRFCFDYRTRIYEDLFKHGSVSYKKVEDWLKQHGEGSVHVRGGQGETKFESKLSSHMFFCQLLGVSDLDGQDRAMAEEIILWSTLFEDRSILETKVSDAYGDRLTDEQIRKIRKKRFTGWGRLSKAFLCDLKAETDDGPKSIMDILEEGDPTDGRIGRAMVLMEILSNDDMNFSQIIEERNKKALADKGQIQVEDLPGSPALHRTINQAVRVVEEIASIAGHAPQNIFIEVTREEDETKKTHRSSRRYNDIKNALNTLKSEGLAEAGILSELGALKHDELDERMTLYFMQNGRSLYSNKPLDIRRLSEYQVDHIIPQSYIKDDSFDNKALVLDSENQRKSDSLLLDESIRRRMHFHWAALKHAKLISEKKYRNLMRSYIGDAQIKGFINRQLVETSQIVKLTQMILSDRYPDANIVPVKAALSSQLRKERGFAKCRDINDYHHAHDAYLACEMGRFIQLRHEGIYENPIGYAHAVRDLLKEDSDTYTKKGRLPGSSSFIVRSFLRSGVNRETGEVWDAEEETARIRRFLNYKDCFISRMPVETSGAFWDATIYSPLDKKKCKGGKYKLIPLKKDLPVEKYGGYSREQSAYFFIYEAVKTKKRVLEFSPVPLSIASTVKYEASALASYAEGLAKAKGLDFVRVVRPKILKYQLIELDGARYFITGMREVRNGRQMAFAQSEVGLVRDLLNGQEVSFDEIRKLFESMLEKMRRYAPKLSSQMNLESLRDRFYGVDLSDQVNTVLSIAGIVAAQRNMIDLSAVGGPTHAGCLNLNFNKILNDPNTRLCLIDQSVTGMFESRHEIGL
ncbi:type II CRISPR RNA-guided endonuclease Cas9 [Slackia exigua]|uniref:type II CRISPR RNA-guided endonuclease Cas9 n=1 Tax=Slackia exigua TaxID=84109 RepID=UPI00254FD6BE|nr:type II CRISPR RNA-guided endonuclease Cas9 [Slackia exigua]MDK7724656.1 type II CRISPR RNA-guided endonuclease Cas9 [Slackia exigua]MDK7726264.1 type II CRISPR RNA-guided endonuclease Cas9 [Slackia exigua]